MQITFILFFCKEKYLFFFCCCCCFFLHVLARGRGEMIVNNASRQTLKKIISFVFGDINR